MLPPKTTALTVPISLAVAAFKSNQSFEEPTKLNLQQLRDPACDLSFQLKNGLTYHHRKSIKTPLKNKAATDNQKIEDSPKQ
jgi:hypothetical protein